MRVAICSRCGRPVKREQPVYLLTTPSNRIDGPYHAVCAYSVNLSEHRGALSATVIPAGYVGREADIGKSTE